jgi:serine/threonine protein kinase/WD40 repeat protein
MQTAEGSLPNDQTDRVSALLEELLETEVLSQRDLLEQLCTRCPDCALALRTGYASLQQMDLLQVGEVAPTTAEPAPPTGGLPRLLGPFRLLEFLGAGGMGTVYRAEDLELKRDVALKLVRGELLASVRTRTRFQRESEALARLDHPGLCTVYRAGTTDGQPWIAMRLVRGTTLAAQIEARRKNGSEERGKRSSSQSREELQRVLLVFEKVVRALASAHAAGIVHRDLKPGNLVLASDDEPVVIDFGLVHIEDAGPHLTGSGDHIGTPAYMAPEQVEARSREPGPGTDVYALGVTLFEALTLQLPYATRGREELFHSIVRGDRRRLRQVDRTLPADLEVVLEKALDLDPARRYASMSEFADDLRRLRQHEPPAARRIGRGLRLRRWCQRNPVAATFLTLLSLGLGTALALNASRQAAWRHSTAMAYGNLAGQLVDENPEHALDMALEGIDLEPGDPESAGHLLHALQEVRPHERWLLPWPSSPRIEVHRTVVSPGGNAAILLGRSGDGVDAAPVLWRGGKPELLPIEGGALDADWSPDGSLFVTAGPSSPPQLWSANGELVTTFAVPDAPAKMKIPRARFLRDAEHVLFACSDGIARIYDRTRDTWTGLAPRLCTRQPGMPGLAVSADGKRIALGDRDGCIVVHETDMALREVRGRVLTTEAPKLLVPPPPGAAKQVDNFELCFGAGGELLQACGIFPRRRSLWTWSGKPLVSWGSFLAPAFAMPLDPTGARVVEFDQDHDPRVWRFDGETLQFECALAGHEGRVTSCGFGANGSILTLGVDGTARLWDLRNGRLELVLRGFDRELQDGAMLGATGQCLMATMGGLNRFDLGGVAGSRLRVGNFSDLRACFLGPEWPGPILTADYMHRLTVHDAAGRVALEIAEPFARRSGLALAADSRWLVSTSISLSQQAQAILYAPGLERAQTITLPMAEPQAAFGPEDQLLLVDITGDGTDDAALYLPTGDGHWTPAPAEVQKDVARACAGAQAIAYHAPTATLALSLPGASVTLFHWSASPPSLQLDHVLLPGVDRANKIAFALDGQTLLLGCRDRFVRRVDRSGHLLTEVTGHIGVLRNVMISPRGDRFLIAATESGITIHDLDGKLILPIRPRTGSVTMAAFLPDGERVLYGTTARATRIVPIIPEQLVTIARAVPHPEMSEGTRRHYRTRVGDDR